MRAMKQERQKRQVKGFNKDSDETAAKYKNSNINDIHLWFNKDSDETAAKYESDEARVVEAAGKMN